MPPKSIGSTVALIGLSTLTAIEAGGCDKRLESLGSVTRSALPLLARASGSAAPEMNYALLDYGLHSRPDWKHVCGRYELRADGRLTSWDLFVTSSDPVQLRKEVELELKRSQKRADPGAKDQPHTDVSVVVDSSSHIEWPRNCPKTPMVEPHGVLVAKRVL